MKGRLTINKKVVLEATEVSAYRRGTGLWDADWQQRYEAEGVSDGQRLGRSPRRTSRRSPPGWRARPMRTSGSPVHRGQLSRKEVATECGFATSVLGQNPLVKKALNDLKTPCVSAACSRQGWKSPQAEPAPLTREPGKLRGAVEAERLRRLETENAGLKAEVAELKRALERVRRSNSERSGHDRQVAALMLETTLRVTAIRSQSPKGFGGCIFTGKPIDDRGTSRTQPRIFVVKANGTTLGKTVVQPGQWWKVSGEAAERSLEVNGFRVSEWQVEAAALFSCDLLASTSSPSWPTTQPSNASVRSRPESCGTLSAPCRDRGPRRCGREYACHGPYAAERCPSGRSLVAVWRQSHPAMASG